MKKKIKIGNRVKIIPTGQTGTVKTLFVNGAMIERDSNEIRKFIIVKFENLELQEK